MNSRYPPDFIFFQNRIRTKREFHVALARLRNLSIRRDGGELLTNG
ncbi:hypothetical protein [Paraburkholderia phytofirmans]|uniref:Uncharacterized protein n=1 Tax=Paraburkholderia phytofirmans TaxID=261302 RepID=A0ABW9B9M4_9BURK